MKKIVKRCLTAIVAISTFFTIFCGIYLAITYAKYTQIPLNAQVLTEPSLSIDIFAYDNTPIDDSNLFNGDYCKLSNLPEYTKQAFISIEDKTFFSHNGINNKRIVKAMLNNIKSGSLKEGASTISQQLIKNTHLSNEKTFERKLKEIALTKKLEKEFSKEEILESYLNIIFFGNNCYGLQDASKFYFNKDASDLNLQESCTLAGIIKSPTKYSPITNYNNALKRRNLILSEMEKDGYITVSEKITAQNTPINLNITPRTNSTNSYSQASLDEASQILSITQKQIATNGYQIHTYQNKDKQTALENALSQSKQDNIDNSGIIINNLQHGVSAYHANSDYKLLTAKRQPGSCLKPILVYGPALNEEAITPSTQILDEPLKIGNYAPQNVNKKFAGYVSTTEAVKNSINIPAIKTLSYIGIDTGKQYAEKMGIVFDEKDDSYSLALGGMTQGTTLKALTTAYTTFANHGQYAPANFVQYITDKNGKLIYLHKPEEKMVFREDSAYLMTNILQETAKTGTARKLSNITNTEVASKTGTVGKTNGNTDAYDIAITPEETIGVWFGSPTNKPQQIAGGNQCASVAKDYIQSQTYTKKEFDIPSSITTLKIDSLEKEKNHRIVLASPTSPERYTETAIFSRFNPPNEMSQNFTSKPNIEATCQTTNENQINLKLKPQKHIEYQIFKDNIPYKTIKNTENEINLYIPFSQNKTNIKITANYADLTDKTQYSEKEFTLSNTASNNHKNPKKSKWYI